MQSFSIVPNFNKLKDFHSSIPLIYTLVAIDAFCFKGLKTEKLSATALSRAVGFPAHISGSLMIEL